MYQESNFVKEFYRVGEVAKFLGTSPKTIRVYVNEGVLESIRTPGNHRLIPKSTIISFLDSKGLITYNTTDKRYDIIYARVSSKEQATKGDLDRQVVNILESVPTLNCPLVVKEVGSGLNDHRKGLLSIIDKITSGQVRNVYVTYKDRLTRFGFNYLRTVFAKSNTSIIIVCADENSKDLQTELVEDMMSILASFNGKLYGMRSRKHGNK